MSRPVFIVNFKNYSEVLGEGSSRLAVAAERLASEVAVDLIVAPPVPSLSMIASQVRIPVYGQTVQDEEEGKSTGAVIPEALSGWGCAGSIINHSESRVPFPVLSRLIPRMKKLKLVSCVCAETPAEVAKAGALGPDMIAIEPKDLIGTGVAVSKARPALIEDSVRAAESVGFKGRMLCGAGIVSGEDVTAALQLGAQGILVASAVVKSKDWDGKLGELGRALIR